MKRSGEYDEWFKVSKSLSFCSVILATCGQAFSWSNIMATLELKQKKKSRRITSFSCKTFIKPCPVTWVYRMHRLYGCKRVRPPNECPVYYTEQSHGEGSSNAGALGNAEHPFTSIAPRSTLGQISSAWEGHIYGQNRTKCRLIQNWIVWMRTVWLKWIAWNRNVFDN